MRLVLFSIFIVLLCCTSCSTSKVSSRPNRSTTPSSSFQTGIIKTARHQIGDRYKYGAKGPNQFDCSGLVHYVYGKNGVQTSGSAASLLKSGKSISRQNAQPGDLVFYKRGGKVFHVSIISKVGKSSLHVIHSTSSRGVMEEDIMRSTYWKPLVYKIISLKSMIN